MSESKTENHKFHKLRTGYGFKTISDENIKGNQKHDINGAKIFGSKFLSFAQKRLFVPAQILRVSTSLFSVNFSQPRAQGFCQLSSSIALLDF